MYNTEYVTRQPFFLAFLRNFDFLKTLCFSTISTDNSKLPFAYEG